MREVVGSLIWIQPWGSKLAAGVAGRAAADDFDCAVTATLIALNNIRNSKYKNRKDKNIVNE